MLVNEGAAAQVLIPVDDRWDPVDLANGQFQGSWLDPQLETTTDPWFLATTGIGFHDAADDSTPQPGEGLEVASSKSQFSSFQNRDGWRYGYWDGATDEDGLYHGRRISQLCLVRTDHHHNTESLGWYQVGSGDYTECVLRLN